MHKDGITVAEYWSELPPKAELEQSCMQLCLKPVSGWRGAGCCGGTWMMSDALTFNSDGHPSALERSEDYEI